VCELRTSDLTLPGIGFVSHVFLFSDPVTIRVFAPASAVFRVSHYPKLGSFGVFRFTCRLSVGFVFSLVHGGMERWNVGVTDWRSLLYGRRMRRPYPLELASFRTFFCPSAASLSAFSPPPVRFPAFPTVRNWVRFADLLMPFLQPKAYSLQPVLWLCFFTCHRAHGSRSPANRRRLARRRRSVIYYTIFEAVGHANNAKTSSHLALRMQDKKVSGGIVKLAGFG
jgi:hypothetical protein